MVQEKATPPWDAPCWWQELLPRGNSGQCSFNLLAPGWCPMNLATLDHFFTRFTVHCSYLGGISRAACVRLGVVQKGREMVAGRITWRAFPSWLQMNHLFSLSLQPLPTLRKHLFLYPNGAAHLSNGDICSQSHVQPGMVVHDPNSQFKATRGYITTFFFLKKRKKI